VASPSESSKANVRITSFWTFCLASQLVAQQIPPIGESIEVSIVNVDVFVTDSQGHRVQGLKKADFEIFEDGKRQQITNFAEYRGEQTAAPTVTATPATAPTPPPQKRTIVIFVDRFTLPQFRSEPMFGAIRSFLHAVVRPGDAVSIVSWRRQIITRLPFTDDLAAIDEVLRKVEKESSFVSVDDQMQILAEQTFEREIVQFAAQQGVTVDRFAGPTLSGEEGAMRAKFEMQHKVSAMNMLINGISGREGTKALILATHRFSRIAGKEYLVGLNAVLGPPDRERDYDMSREIESVTKTANANNVRIYALYPEGLGSAAIATAELRQSPSPVFDAIVLDNELHAMQEVSSKTGGSLAWGSKNIVDALPAIKEDFDSYYSLAYRATTSRADRAHKIVVKVANRSYTVRARGQYVEKSDTTRMNDRVVANLFGSTSAGIIPVRISLGMPKKKAKEQRFVPVIVSFPSAALTTLAQKGAFSVYIGSGNALGQVTQVTHQTQSFAIPPNAKPGDFTYEFELLVDGKTTLVSIGVIDEVSKEFGLARVVPLR